MIEVVRYTFLSLLVVACGHPASPAQPSPAPAPEPPPAETASASTATPPAEALSKAPTTCAEGRDDSPPGSLSFGHDGYAPERVRPGIQATSICIGDITTDTTVDVNGLRASLLNNVNAFKHCYADVLDHAPDLGAGMVTASLLLLRSGTAMDVRVEGFVPEVADCVTRELAHTAFPFLDAKANITVAISFSPATPPGAPK